MTTAGPVAAGPSYRIIQPQVHHGRGVYETICRANGYDPDKGRVPGVFGLAEWSALLARFGAGQRVAVVGAGCAERVIGVALALRTDHPPSAQPRSWHETIGDLSLAGHEPHGRWLYGVEKAVHPEFQGRGVGKALYEAQFRLVARLRLRGIYAGGMLKGYERYRNQMSVLEYAGRVMRGELFDPTVSVQLRRGFKARAVLENYAWDPEAQHTGMLIVWEAPRRGEPSTPERRVQPR